MSQRALVTGASQGLGHALASHLVDRGWEVIAAARRPPNVRGAVNVSLDVTTHADQFDVDLLVNNAAVLDVGPLLTAEVEASIAVNTLGCLRMARLVAPAMISRSSGRIIGISTRLGHHPEPLLGTYAASKIAGEMIHRVLAAELAPAGIAVHVVFPGAFESAMQDQLRTSSSPLQAAALENHGRLNDTNSIAALLLHRCLDLDEREVEVGSSYRQAR
jgi:NAD(P)-dependent dehydrogenase (short-subunit alcohol dehydrogenase family)